MRTIHRFTSLAELLGEIISEENESNGGIIKDSTILQVATALCIDYENEVLREDENYELYYVGITDDYCGQMYKDLEID